MSGTAVEVLPLQSSQNLETQNRVEIGYVLNKNISSCKNKKSIEKEIIQRTRDRVLVTKGIIEGNELWISRNKRIGESKARNSLFLWRISFWFE